MRPEMKEIVYKKYVEFEVGEIINLGEILVLLYA